MDKDFSNSVRCGRAAPTLQVAVLVVALCLYLLVWFLMAFDVNAYLQIDSADYRLLGKSIFTDLSFPSSFRTPVFPFFQGFWETLLGLNVSQYILSLIHI